MDRSKDIDMSERRFGPELRVGCVHITKADRLPLASAFVNFTGSEASIALYGKTPAPWDGLSLVSIQMYKLPWGNAELQRLTEWFGADRKKRARLPDGVAFDESTLAIRNVPDGWEHTAFARSGRDVIHIYRSKRHAVLIRFLGKAGTILDNPLFKRIHRNLSIVAGQWFTEFPANERRGRARAAFVEKRLPAGVRKEIAQAAEEARAALELGPKTTAARTAEAIHRALEESRAARRGRGEDREDLAINLGALWGEALCAGAKWGWCRVRDRDGRNHHVVASGNRSHMVSPIGAIHNILSSRKAANNSLLLFNMIVSGNLPESSERTFCPLG